MAERRSNRGTTTAERTAYEQILFRLRMDKADLSRIQSNAGKAKLKSERLPDYQPWIDGVLAADTGQADEVITTVMIWAADAGDIAQALRIGQYVLRHKIPMPDQYKRTTASVIAEESADLALRKGGIGWGLLVKIAELTEKQDMPDEVRAKLYKAIGYAQRDDGLLIEARAFLTHALQLHDKIGVKKDIERLDTLIKNAGASAEGDA